MFYIEKKKTGIPDPKSVDSLVWQQSMGNTIMKELAPASPIKIIKYYNLIIFIFYTKPPAMNLIFVFSIGVSELKKFDNTDKKRSLKEKFNACNGIYLIIFARFPLQNERIP